jgi:hypothetical protein
MVVLFERLIRQGLDAITPMPFLILPKLLYFSISFQKQKTDKEKGTPLGEEPGDALFFADIRLRILN